MITLFVSCVLASSSISVWTRAPGQYSFRHNPTDVAEKTVSLSATTTRDLFDVQYRQRHTYRGVPLVDVLAANRPEKGIDTALLHFDNGVVIDLPLADAARLDVFIALQMRDAAGVLLGNFPEVTKEGTLLPDWPPVRFGDNKVVVQSREHPSVPSSARAGFSPWTYASSLTGIEFVNRIAYFVQFMANDGVAPAVPVFEARCHFCHAIRGAGGHYGWDFITPDSLLSVHSEAQLFVHVTRGEGHAADRQMPPLPDMNEKETDDMWRLMKASVDAQLKPYKPLRGTSLDMAP